ncbi:titin [Aedes aegypti]|uniref:Uncharacterized protein n=1 Tax=Aedes aegypti TaxID=7159 RepID=A0A6I8U298_AEDAE|nr:titin [Aedes aegypti]
MNRGGAVETKTPLKDGGGELGRATKSGRKVKRPAHFDDSPDAKRMASLDEVSPKRKEVPESVKKSARKTLLKNQPEESSPKRNGEPAGEVVKKSARKTLNKQEAREEEPEPTQRSSRKTMTVVTRDESPEPEVAKKSARKTLLKSAVKNSAEQTPDTPKKDKPAPETPKKSAKKAEPEEETPAGPGISRTGRKIKIPAHLKEFEDVVVASPKKEVPEKPSMARKSLAPVALEKEEVVPPKTPGRGRSLAAPKKAPEPEPKEVKIEPKTPRRGKSTASLEIVEQDDPLAIPASPREVKSPRKDKQAAKSPVKAPKPIVDPLEVEEELPVKTSRRGKSLAAPEAAKSPVKEDKPPAKTPSKRGRSMAAPAPSSPPVEKLPKTPKQSAVAKPVEDLLSSEPVSRSGRKIKPKKYFGEFEEEEVVIVAAPVKVASPVKAVVKSSPVAKAASPKVIVKSSPLAKKESPARAAVPKKDSPPKPKAASPVKRHHLAVEKTMELPKKRAKLLEPKEGSGSGGDEVDKKLDEISPNTEERLITKRGVNDHHHAAKEEDEEVEAMETAEEAVKETSQPITSNDKEEEPTKIDKQAVEENKPKRGRKPLKDSAAKPEAAPVAEESKPDDEPEQQPEKPKRGRKTLPAPPSESSDDAEESAPPKAPKTPVARRMTTALVSAPAAEDTGSSRSGRKIKPKKFFGEDEPVSASKPKAAAPVNGTGGGRGRRKTLAAELDKASDSVEAKEDKAEEVVMAAPQAEVEKCPSREEILAVVGAVDPVKQAEEQPDAKVEEENQEVKKDDEPTPMEEDLPQEPEPEPITTPVVGTAPEEAVAEDIPQTTDEPEPMEEDLPLATDNGGDSASLEEPVQEGQIESLESEGVHDDEAEPVVQEEDESTLQEPETVESTREDFQEHSIPQTSPRRSQPTTEEAPKSPAPLHEEPPAPLEQSDPEPVPVELVEAPEVTEVAEEPENDEIAEDAIEAPVQETPEELLSAIFEEPAAPTPAAEPSQQTAEVSASSSFSEALCVEEESAEQVGVEVAKIDDSKDQQQYESVEFLEMSGASTVANEPATVEELPVEHTNGHEDQMKNRISTPELEDDLDDTEAPPMDDLDDEKEDELLDDVSESKEATFSERDRDNESIIVIPDTPKPPKSEFDAEFDLADKSPVPQSSHTTVARVELHHSPVISQGKVPTTPRTPDSKPSKTSCSPDKPDDQDQANVPHEIIDITESPIAVLDPKLHHSEGKPGSTTSTPLRMGTKMTAKDRLIQNSRKRSLSASDAEIVKKNVTFHSPANSTMLVDTIDERLKKKNESATKIPPGHRKRSLSEHKDAQQDGPKPSKISKLPNFKNIHQQQFSRMESIEEFHNRKVQRAKEILASSTVKSPAASALVRSAERPPLQKSSSLPPKSPYKSGNGASSSSFKPAVVRPLIPKPSESHHKPLSDADRQEKRQKQFHATFKPKSQEGSGSSSTGKDTPDGAHRVIEQSRHKQSQILKGVRTNKRFELMMKYRDAQE